jgi:hypothetical protein
MRRTVLAMSAAAGAAVLIALFALAPLTLRAGELRSRVAAAIEARLNADVSIDQLHIAYAPRIRVSGSGFVLRIKNRPDLPPFVSIDRFWMNLGIFQVVRRHVGTVYVEGLRIHVPPPAARRGLGAGGPASAVETALRPAEVRIDRLVAHDAELTFVPRTAGKRPLVFPIDELEMSAVGLDLQMSFHATLTNPIPRGRVEAHGTFGPWQKADPAQTRVGGDYIFSDADLATFNGLAGKLSSTGTFEGPLTDIGVAGRTETPDFSLELGGRPVPLTTTFQATVDGTDGTTVLRRVNGTLVHTAIVAKGAITTLRGQGHSVDLDVEVTDGRIEDLLRLAIDSPRPIMTGDVSLHSTVVLPPGPEPVRERLRLDGRLGLGGARFTDRQLQDKLEEISRRSQGLNERDVMERVATDVSGRFALAAGIFTLSNASFDVPGARVSLAGAYMLNDGALDLGGTLQMRASVSKAVGGFTSILLKPFDLLFKKQGADTVVPIKITVTLRAPRVGLDVKRVLKR